jgi:hypothetical protein
LQDIVRAAVEKGGARLTSVQIGAPKEEGRYRQIVLNVQVIGNVATLQKTLYTLESTVPYVFVDMLRINSTQFRGARVSAGLEPDVTVQMDISAYAPIATKGWESCCTTGGYRSQSRWRWSSVGRRIGVKRSTGRSSSQHRPSQRR